jgi:hypothetical protein
MPRPRHIEPFFLIVADRDQGVFSVEGPMTDDTQWNSAVCRAQETGRQVNCYSAGNDRQVAITEYRQAYGLRLVDPGSIVRRAGR